jgi:hypothetical protein
MSFHEIGQWLQAHEYVAVWVEGIALILIFGLDYINRHDERRDKKQQHEETQKQLGILSKQANAAKEQADFAFESLNLLKRQTQDQQLRELWRVLPILDDIQGQVRYWLNLFDENRWNAVNKASKIMPADSSSVLIQAARHSNGLWTEVREVLPLVSNADYQIDRYYAEDRVAYRQESLIKTAHANLKNAEPRLTHIVGEFTMFEESERKMNAIQEAAERKDQ